MLYILHKYFMFHSKCKVLKFAYDSKVQVGCKNFFFFYCLLQIWTLKTERLSASNNFPGNLVFHIFICDLKTRKQYIYKIVRGRADIYSCFMLRLLSMCFILALKKPLISAPRSDGHQPVINLPTEQPHAPNLAPGKILISRCVSILQQNFRLVSAIVSWTLGAHGQPFILVWCCYKEEEQLLISVAYKITTD